MHLAGEVFDHNLDLFGDGMLVQVHERLEQVGRLAALVTRVVRHGLEQVPVGAIGGVVLQDVEDEVFIDGLAHGVEAEGCERTVGTLDAEHLHRLRLGRGGEGEVADVGQPAVHPGDRDDAVLQVVSRLLVLPLGGFEACDEVARIVARGQHLAHLARAGAGLRRVRLVDDDREAVAGQLLHLVGDHRELLERGDNDRLAVLQRLAELPRGGVDVLHHPFHLLELAHGALELAVEHAAVGDDDDGIEDAAVPGVVQDGKLVRQPGDGVALARSRAVLDQVALPRPPGPRVGHQAAHRVELVVAREDEAALAGLAALVVLLFHDMEELLQQVQHAVARPDLLPQVGGGEAAPGGRVARAAIAALVERQEARRRAAQAGGHVDQVRVGREMRQAAAEREERLLGVAVEAVLADGILDVLAGQRVLQFRGENGQAVQEEDQVQAVLVLQAVVHLAADRKEVAGVELAIRLVQPAGRPEVGELEFAAVALDPLPQDVQRAALLDLGGEPLQQPVARVRAVQLLELLPFLGLGGVDEGQGVLGDQAEGAIVLLRRPPQVAAGGEVARRLAQSEEIARRRVRPAGQERGFDGRFEVLFGDVNHESPLTAHSPGIPKARAASSAAPRPAPEGPGEVG